MDTRVMIFRRALEDSNSALKALIDMLDSTETPSNKEMYELRTKVISAYKRGELVLGATKLGGEKGENNGQRA